MDAIERHMKRLDALVDRAFGWNELVEMLARLAVFGPLVVVSFCWLVAAELLGKD